MRIRKPVQNFVIDVASLVALVFLVATGFLMRYTLPPGQGHGRTVLGLSRHDWGGLHFWVSIALLVLLVVHLLLHWKWIVTMVRGRVAETSGRRVVLSIAGVFALLLVVIAPFLLPVHEQERGGEGRGRSALEQINEAPTDPSHVSRTGGSAGAVEEDGSCALPVPG